MDTYSIISGQGCPHTLVYSVVLKYLKISHCDKRWEEVNRQSYVDMGHMLRFNYMETWLRTILNYHPALIVEHMQCMQGAGRITYDSICLYTISVQHAVWVWTNGQIFPSEVVLCRMNSWVIIGSYKRSLPLLTPTVCWREALCAADGFLTRGGCWRSAALFFTRTTCCFSEGGSCRQSLIPQSVIWNIKGKWQDLVSVHQRREDFFLLQKSYRQKSIRENHF